MLPDGVNKENQYTQHVDIFAFGLCLLELATLRRLDSNNCQIWPDLLETVTHDDAKQLILRCLDPQGVYPSAAQLLQDAFFMRCVSAHTKHALANAVQTALLHLSVAFDMVINTAVPTNNCGVSFSAI